MTAAILLVSALALLSGPAAGAFLYLLHRRHPGRWLRLFLGIEACITATLLLNAGNTVYAGVLGFGDPRVLFLVLTGVSACSLAGSYLLVLLVHELTGRPLSPVRRGLFLGLLAGLSGLGLFVALPVPGEAGAPNLPAGYTVSTLGGVLLTGYALAWAWVHRRSLPPYARDRLPLASGLLAGLSLLSLANDLIGLSGCLWGTSIPFSPLYFLTINLFILVLAGRHLPGPPAETAPPPSGGGSDGTWADGAGLTDREREVLDLLLQGLSNEDIGGRLFISPHTAKNHVHAVFRKLGVRSRMDLIRRSRAGKSGE